MSGFFYYLLTFAESVTSVVGLRFPYEQPRYVVEQDIGHSAEIRRYDPRLAIEATIDDPDRGKAASEAFSLLFRYITGANQRDQKIAMTAPVQTRSERIAMTVPVQTTSANDQIAMRFFLPQAVEQAGAPAPLDPRLHLVRIPATTIAALRYSGIATQATRDQKAAQLKQILATTAWKPQGEVFQLNYDPPFTIPFLRRNEVAVTVSK
ncbi:SOUL family heme-binding protein [Rhodopila sp.]|uniref:SOUL family heme-binding protein n=1 Tax=Rhodopila sp. TaxID=2480087 RepID=UPI003D0FBB4D